MILKKFKNFQYFFENSKIFPKVSKSRAKNFRLFKASFKRHCSERLLSDCKVSFLLSQTEIGRSEKSYASTALATSTLLFAILDGRNNSSQKIDFSKFRIPNIIHKVRSPPTPPLAITTTVQSLFWRVEIVTPLTFSMRVERGGIPTFGGRKYFGIFGKFVYENALRGPRSGFSPFTRKFFEIFTRKCNFH